MTDLHDPTVTVPRDRWNRPMVIPVDGGRPVAYTRCTTYVGVLEDMNALMRWHGRMVALGLSERADLALAVVAHRDDKEKLNKICDDAKEYARAGAAATTGTALHALTERVDRGEPLGKVPAEFAADLAAYETQTKRFAILPIDIERFTVRDDLKIGGTPDRIVAYQGRRYVFDLKTGSDPLRYGAGKIAMQLAVYANSQGYDPTNGARCSLAVDKKRAIVAHLPAGAGRCTLHWIDIAAGWQAVDLAGKVRAWRARKDLARLFGSEQSEQSEPVGDDTLAQLVAAAPSAADLRNLWATHAADWTPALTDAAKARLAQLGAA